MFAQHKVSIIAFMAAPAAMAFAAPATAASFDPAECAAIQNVEVPYDVSFGADRIAFKNSGRRIVIAPGYVEVDGHRFVNATLNATYYGDMRGFLQSAGEFPKIAAEFGKSAVVPWGTETADDFRGDITGMCRAILTLAEDQRHILGAFAEFAAPVEITLAAQRL